MSVPGQFLLYTAPDGAVKVDVFCRDETVWLTQKALAELFGVTRPAVTKRLPEDFCFRLTSDEKEVVVANCDRFRNLRYAKALPIAFAEHGALQAANVSSSHRMVAVKVCMSSAASWNCDTRLRQGFGGQVKYRLGRSKEDEE